MWTSAHTPTFNFLQPLQVTLTPRVLARQDMAILEIGNLGLRYIHLWLAGIFLF